MKGSARVTISVECAGLQTQVPRHISHPWRFSLKVLLAASIGAAGSALTLHGEWRLAVVGVFIEGLVFAHMLELVHSCIHGTAFGARHADRIAGVLLGLPMLVSFSDYRNNHLEHHRTLGKSEKKDFFGYEFEGMTTWLSFVRHLLMAPDTIETLQKNLCRAATRWNWSKIPAAAFDSQIEYLLMALWLLIPLGALLMGQTGPFLVMVLPCLVAIPCHVLIELPEHWHCPPVDNPLIHTRSISASRIATLVHKRKQLSPGAPPLSLAPKQRAARRHRELRTPAAHYQPSYFRFYLQVIRSLRLN